MNRRTITNIGFYIIIFIYLSIMVISSVYIENSDGTFVGTRNKTVWNGTGITLGQDNEQELNVTDGWFDYSNIISHWTFNNGNDGLVDNAGQDNNLTLTGGSPIYKIAKINNGSEVTSDDYQFSMTPNSKEMTLSFWADFQSQPSLGIFWESGADYNPIDGGTAIFLNTDIGGCTNAMVAFIQDATASSKYRAECITSPQYPTTGWKHYVFYFNNTNTVGDIKIWVDGTEQNTTIGLSNKDQNSDFYSGTYNLFSRNSASYPVSNISVDEWVIFNGSLTQTQVNEIYLRQRDNFFPSPLNGKYATYSSINKTNGNIVKNITWNVINDSNTRINVSYEIDENGTNYNCGYNSPCLIGITPTNNITVDFIYTTDNANKSPTLINWTLGLSAPVNATTNYTSVNHFDIEYKSIVFNSNTYILYSNTTFNLSQKDGLILRGMANLEKATVPVSSDVYAKFILNGVNVYEGKVRTVETIGDVGSVKVIVPNIISGIVGENYLSVELRETGTGSVNISNAEFHILTNRSRHNNMINHKLSNYTFDFNATSYYNPFNITSTYLYNSSSFLDVSHSINASGTDIIDCYLGNIDTSPVYSRYLSSSSDSGSTGLGYYSKTNISGSVIWNLLCKSLNNEDISNNFNYLLTEMKDSNERIINGLQISNSSINKSNPLVLTAGDNLIQSETINIKDGNELEAVGNIIVQSTTGTQTPVFYLEYLSVVNRNSSKVPRYLSSNNDIGTINMYSSKETSIGDNVTVNLHLIVPTGETINVLDYSIGLIELNQLSITEGNIAPIVFIDYPSNGGSVKNTDWINMSISDANGNIDFCNVTTYTLSGTLKEKISSSTTTNIQYNWEGHTAGDFELNVVCIDQLGLTAQDSVNITVQSGGLTDEESSCILYGVFLNGSTCAIGSLEEEVNAEMISIIGLLLIVLAQIAVIIFLFRHKMRIWRMVGCFAMMIIGVSAVTIQDSVAGLIFMGISLIIAGVQLFKDVARLVEG